MFKNSQSIAEHRPWMITITVMLVAMLEVLDSTIVNVSLPHMMASLNANSDQITWVLTSYIVASAVMLPLTGFLSHRVGRKNLLLINITGFMCTSALCGLTSSLESMVVLRIFQGLFGSVLIPLSQSVMRETFPPEEMGKAMAIWGVGIMTAPILGPTLGGFITENFNWRWIFYLNVPICLIAFMMACLFLPKSSRKKIPADYTGLSLMVVAIASLQLFLDQGNQKDWLDSNFIVYTLMISVLAWILFIVRSVQKKKQNIVNLLIYQDRNFRLASILMFLFCGSCFSILALQPLMLEHLLGYSPITTGIVMAPRGIASAVAMVVAVPVMKKGGGKILLFIGVICCAVGSYWLAHLSLNMSVESNFFPTWIQGFGMGLFMVPISAYSLATLAPTDITEGAGLFAYSRMLGTSVGISVFTTLVTRETQVVWNRLSQYTTSYNPNVQHWFSAQHLDLFSPQGQAVLQNEVARQANMVAFNDAFFIITIAFILMLPLILRLKNVSMGGKSPMGEH